MYIKIFIDINYERSDGYSEYREYIQVWWMNNSGANIGQQLCLPQGLRLSLRDRPTLLDVVNEREIVKRAVLTTDGCEK